MLISTNIIRDEDLEFDYVVTSNTQRVFEDITNTKGKSTKCFNLVGSYGTGKSSFLVAFEQTLRGKQHFFSTKGLDGKPKFVKLVGRPAAFLDDLRNVLGLPSSSTQEDVLAALEKLGARNTPVYLVVDEFGKYLEFALTNDPKTAIYFFQQLAERINSNKNQLHWVGTLHQNLDTYSLDVDDLDAQEWEKVSGRFVTLTFNEPPTTLLRLMQHRLKAVQNSVDDHVLQSANNCVQQSGVIPNDFYEVAAELGPAIKPFDALSSYLSIRLLQKYGQNERSVFSFLSADCPGNPKSFHFLSYTAYDLVEFAMERMAHFIFSNSNPDKLQWEAAERAIQRCDSHAEIDPHVGRLAVRHILLIGLFGKEGSDFTAEKLETYLNTVTGSNQSQTVAALIDKNIIQYLRHKGKLVFVEGTDVNIQNELRAARKLLSPEIDLLSEVVNRIQLTPKLSRGHYIKTGTPRFLYFVLHSQGNSGKSRVRWGNAVCHVLLDRAASYSPTVDAGFPEIVVVPKDVRSVKQGMRDVMEYELVLDKYADDLVVKQLITQERDFVMRQLQTTIESLMSDPQSVWHLPGKKSVSVCSDREVNELIQRVFSQTYNNAPVVHNELINQQKLSVSINTGRRHLMSKLESRFTNPDLGFERDRFPAERSIFLSTWSQEGLYDWKTGELKSPSESSSYALAWSACDQFLNTAGSGKVSLTSLFETLEKAPYGMKRGFIDFWIPLYLMTKEDEFALYYGQDAKYLPYLSTEIFDSLLRKPADFSIKKFNVGGISQVTLNQYREIAGIDGLVTDARSTYLKIFTNFVLLIRNLNKYGSRTEHLSPEAIKLRAAIEQAPDPETALFQTIPAAIGFHDIATSHDDERVELYIHRLKETARELASSYQELLNRILQTIASAFGCKPEFDEVQKTVRLELQAIDTSRLPQRLNTIQSRLISPLDDAESWVKSVADVILGRSLETLLDSEEPELHERIIGSIEGLRAHQGLTQSPEGSIAVAITRPNGQTERRFVQLKEDQKPSLVGRIDGMSSAERLALIALIVELESEKVEWGLA